MSDNKKIKNRVSGIKNNSVQKGTAAKCFIKKSEKDELVPTNSCEFHTKYPHIFKFGFLFFRCTRMNMRCKKMEKT